MSDDDTPPVHRNCEHRNCEPHRVGCLRPWPRCSRPYWCDGSCRQAKAGDVWACPCGKRWRLGRQHGWERAG